MSKYNLLFALAFFSIFATFHSAKNVSANNLSANNVSVQQGGISQISTPITNAVYEQGEFFTIPILISSPVSSINAFSIVADYPENIEFIGTDEGGAISVLWIEKPHIEKKRIIFSGTMPTGFTEVLNPLNKEKSPGLITKLIFRAIKTGDGEIKAIPDIYLNDGLGTKTTSSGFTLLISIGENFANGENTKYQWNDKILPELFTPTIEQNPALYGGKFVLIFNTTDKDSGIARYEVKEGSGDWKEAISPYLIIDQTLSSAISVKAVDKAGNVRLVAVGNTQNKVNSISLAVQKILGYFTLLILILIIILRKRNYKLK